MIKKSDLVFVASLLMIYQELAFTTQYGGLVMCGVTLFGYFVTKSREE